MDVYVISFLNGSGPSTGWVTVQVSCRSFWPEHLRRARHPKHPTCFTWFQTKTAALMSSCWMVLDDLEQFWIHICHLDIGFSTFVANVGLAKAQGKELMRRATDQSLVTTVPEKPGGNEPSVNKSLFHGWSSLQEDHKGRLKRRWPRVRIAKSLWPLAFKLSHGDTSHFPVPFAFKDADQREKEFGILALAGRGLPRALCISVLPRLRSWHAGGRQSLDVRFRGL